DQKTARNLQSQGRTYFGVLVKAVDATQGTITFGEERVPAELAGKTFPVAKDAFIQIDGKQGRLASIPQGALVHPELAADKKTATNLFGEGRTFPGGQVKSVDAAKHTITFEEERGPAELAGKTMALAQGANIQIDGKPGKLKDVPQGAIVTLTLS